MRLMSRGRMQRRECRRAPRLVLWHSHKESNGASAMPVQCVNTISRNTVPVRKRMNGRTTDQHSCC